MVSCKWGGIENGSRAQEFCHHECDKGLTQPFVAIWL